jgi:hypothetical protein
MMHAKKRIARNILITLMCLTPAVFGYAQTGDNPLGQTIQINTQFRSFSGKPIWSLIIRDLDHNENIPYIFDINRGQNHWVIFTYGHNYLITASNMQIEIFQPGRNKYKNIRIKNFCGLESHGRIIRGESMHIMIGGDLSPNADTLTCNIASYPDPNFYIYRSDGPP